MTNPLQTIWPQIHPKTKKNGKEYVQYSDKDLLYLYQSQFADQKKCSLNEWKNSFRDSLQTDGTYLVSYEQFLAKAKYYNTRMPSSPPFDPATLKEGVWSEAELDRLFREKIQPETLYTFEEWQEIKEKLRRLYPKQLGQVPKKEGGLFVSDLFKKEVQIILDKFPSVMRLRAIQMQKDKASSGKSHFEHGPEVSQGIVEKFRRFLRFGPR
ncbi:MAG: hypothetical protein Q7S98_05160 [Deltaproteobacteria bacterium]|nr:hypothetical protein [Deltaproteobacteria bacterium]